MKIRNLKIETQLKFGFIFIFFLVIVLGTVSYIQTEEIHLQTEKMYNHPINVRRAIGDITKQIMSMRIQIKDLFVVEDDRNRQNILTEMPVSQFNVEKEIEILKQWYLGPQTDIDNLSIEFKKWFSIRSESLLMFKSGKTGAAKNRHFRGGIAPEQVQKVLNILNEISSFAENKSDELYNNSKILRNTLNRQRILLISIIILFLLIISYTLMRNIRNPLISLTKASKRFKAGDMSARSSYKLKNEFGDLSDSFNNLTENVEFNTVLNEKVVNISALLLSKFEIKEFFKETITALATNTESQMAAIYLLNTDKNTFEHFDSTGVDDNARQSFSADRFEGEFGSVLSTRKVQYIKTIPEDTRFTFHTVSGKFIPKEIITIPIQAKNQVVAIISLASVNTYSKQSIQLIDKILTTLSARIEGIMAYHKMKELSERLEAQTIELEEQSAELTEQNTELEMQKTQLNEVSRLKTNFLSNMSHELRTPLNSVIALSGVLNRKLSKKIPDEEYSYLEIIERNGKHLLDLINDILDISRIESGKEDFEIIKFNISEPISEIVNMIDPQAKQSNTEIINLITDSGLSLTSDAGKFRHIMQNIISNAVKFTENGKVEIKALQKDENLIITVTDNGVGIDENHIIHIFDEFRQADGSTSRKFGGTGLGLAIAKKYTNLLGGTISVKSILEEGSEFTVSIPLQYKIQNQIIEEDTANELKYKILQSTDSPVLGSEVKTILLIEDSEPAIIQIKDFLEESGYQIMVARNGTEGLETITKSLPDANTSISQSLPDAIILDLMMPEIDGFEVLKTIRDSELTAHIPVMILTAKHITKDELSVLRSNNIHQLIQKGDINRIELMNAVAGMLFKQPEIKTPKSKPNNIIGKLSVLVVEDNPDNMITVKALIADNYTVIEAVNGEEGIALTKKHKPDLVLMDIALPITDGILAFKTIRRDPSIRHIPVIALTASAMTSDRETILAHGFDGYIPKPIAEKDFFKTINEVLYGK
ncbi:MAG: response regulator [Candidatus Delongbacteria bacterium]|jgi:signal transduction histidine kinase/CheY-like chemotaxis protein/HAMP domain-containing protein|nr:response regulator [Candidatus Delongbacteria bacterium]